MNQEETMLLHKERYKETIKNLTVMSDILARNVFKDKNACEYVLRIILEDKELTVIDNETQMDFRNMPTTSLRFAFSFVIFFPPFGIGTISVPFPAKRKKKAPQRRYATGRGDGAGKEIGTRIRKKRLMLKNRSATILSPRFPTSA